MPNPNRLIDTAAEALARLANIQHGQMSQPQIHHLAQDAATAIATYTRETLLTQIVNLSPDSVHAIALEYAKMTGKPPAATHSQKTKPNPNQKELPLNDP